MYRAALLSTVLVFSACHAATTREPVATTTTTNASAPAARDEGGGGGCLLFCGGASEAAPVVAPTPDHHAEAVAAADRVFASMHGDLLACYKARVAVSPNAHASLTVDVVIAPDGSVLAVETTGGALLGDRTMRCITSRIESATFAPVLGGGRSASRSH